MSANTLVNNARNVFLSAKKLCEVKPTKANLKKVNKAQKQLDKAYTNAEAVYMQGNITYISKQQAEKKHDAAWTTLNELTGRQSTPPPKIKGGSAKTRKANQLQHFTKPLGEPPPKTSDNQTLKKIQIAENLNIPTDSFSSDELHTVIKPLSNNKSPGLENIPAFVWKDQVFHDLLLKLCNRSLLRNSPPTVWLKSGIVPIPKKGNLIITINYRGISLISIAAKI